jgi:hypothetical protein
VLFCYFSKSCNKKRYVDGVGVFYVLFQELVFSQPQKTQHLDFDGFGAFVVFVLFQELFAAHQAKMSKTRFDLGPEHPETRNTISF